MADINIIILAGHLTRDPELKHLAGGQAVANVGLAVNRRYKTQAGEQREEVLFVDCEAWGGTAESITKNFCKGKAIAIEGRLKLDQWETDGGEKRSKHKVSIDRWHFVGSKDDGDSARTDRAPASRSSTSQSPAIDEDDIPF